MTPSPPTPSPVGEGVGGEGESEFFCSNYRKSSSSACVRSELKRAEQQADAKDAGRDKKTKKGGEGVRFGDKATLSPLPPTPRNQKWGRGIVQCLNCGGVCSRWSHIVFAAETVLEPVI